MRRRLVLYDGKGNISVEEREIQKVKEYEVLVKVYSSLISPGTEIGMIKRLRENPSDRIGKRSFGYGNSGIVISCGKKCKYLKEGMRVACMGTGYALHTDYAIVPENLCVQIPENVSYEEGSFAHLAATSLHAIRRATLEFGEYVLIAGLGIIGNTAGQLSLLSGCHTIGIDLYKLRRKIAERVGFERVIGPEENFEEECKKFSSGYGIDTSFICFGGDATDMFEKIIKVMKTAPDTHKMGKIVIPGGCSIKISFGATVGNIDIRSSARTGPGYHDPEYEKGKDYPKVFIRWPTRKNLEEVIKLISERKLRVKELITHRFPIEEAPEAVEILISNPDKCLGVILKPWER